MERYDIAIIGTGPAGVSAAITAKIRGRKILLIGNNKISDKVSKAQTAFTRMTSQNVSSYKLDVKGNPVR